MENTKHMRISMSKRIEHAKKAKSLLDCDGACYSIDQIKRKISNYIKQSDSWNNVIESERIFIKNISEKSFSETERLRFSQEISSYVWVAFSENDNIIQVGKTSIGSDDIFDKIKLKVSVEILLRIYGSESFNNELSKILDRVNELYKKAIIIPIKKEYAKTFEKQIGDYLLLDNPIILTHSHSDWYTKI